MAKVGYIFFSFHSNVSATDGTGQSGDSSDLSSAVQVDETFEIQINLGSSTKWENMNLDEHLQISTVAGLIDKKYQGASHYINDRPNSAQVTRTLGCRIKTKREHLDLKTLVSQDAPCIVDHQTEIPKLEATHVVVGVTYGAEAYYVLAQELVDKDQNDQDAKEDVEENLPSIGNKMENYLRDNQNLMSFKDQLDKKEQELINKHLKCRLYSDFQSSTGTGKSLKTAVVKARKEGDDVEVEGVVNIAENHPLFKPSRLKRWLSYRSSTFNEGR